MSVQYKNRAIVAAEPFWKETKYDVGNNRVSAQFNGRGAVSRYAVMNKYKVFKNFYAVFSVDGVPTDWGVEKTVTMIGRKQVTEFGTEKASFRIIQFLDGTKNAVYTRVEVTANADLFFSGAFNFDLDFNSYVEQLFKSRKGFANLCRVVNGAAFGKKPRVSDKVVRSDVFGDMYLDVAASEGLTALSKSWKYYYQYSYGGQVKGGQTKCFDFVIGAGTRSDYTFTDVLECLNNFDVALKDADTYIAELPMPCGLTEFQQSYYTSLINCSLSNYKELGKFKGYLAGITYQFPARTYFRDGYWTVLSVLSARPDTVRNEIITLASGIDKKTGKCPSAVKFDFKNYWGDHYDSPSFFVIMLYDYVAHTKDFSVLTERVPCGTVLGAATKVLARIQGECDDTGLLVKNGRFNCRDWCDNVYRDGYCTYDEALYARALFALAELLRHESDPSATGYYKEYERVKQAINDLLWDEDLGYFVNYKSGDFTENNLSVDTVVIPLFGLTDDERAKRMLTAMEQKLESKNNSEQCAGDFGVLSVWPPYKDITDEVHKSTLPYYYHNGGEWPYLSAAYAYAKLMYGMEYEYPLYRWFTYNAERGNFTPVEFFSPLHEDGSLLQAWSSLGVLPLSFPDGDFFRKTL